MTHAFSAIGRERLRHLASTLDGHLVLPDDAAYDEARQVWNRAVDRRPAAIVGCTSVDDVRRGLEFAETHRLEIAVRSGGHSQAGHGVADGALVLDLRGLNRVAVDPSLLRARVEGGAIVSELMTALEAYVQTAGGLMGTPHGPTLMVSFCYCGVLAQGERIADRWRTRLRPTKDTVQAGPYTAEFSMGDGPSTGGGAFLPELSDAVIDLLASSYSNAPPDASAVWNDFHGAVTRVPIEATAFSLHSARGRRLLVIQR